MKHTLLPALFVLLAVASCKSGDEDPNPVPTNLLSGYLTVSRQLDLDSPATKYTESAFAAFFMHPYAQPSDTMHIIVDSVHLNGFSAAMDNATRIYRVAGPIQANTSCNWQVWSGTNVASFTYNFSTPYPTYAYKLPDTIDRASAFSIPVPVGSDSTTFALSANMLLRGSYKGTTGSFSASELSTLNSGNATLQVSGYKMTTQAFGGKNFRFTKVTIKTKPVWLK